MRVGYINTIFIILKNLDLKRILKIKPRNTDETRKTQIRVKKTRIGALTEYAAVIVIAYHHEYLRKCNYF